MYNMSTGPHISGFHLQNVNTSLSFVNSKPVYLYSKKFIFVIQIHGKYSFVAKTQINRKIAKNIFSMSLLYICADCVREVQVQEKVKVVELSDSKQ